MGHPLSLEEKKALPNCGNKDGNIINVLKHFISTSVASFEVYEMTVPICTHMSLVFGVYVHLHFTFMHLADTFIQSDLQCFQSIHFFFGQYVFILTKYISQLLCFCSCLLHTITKIQKYRY